VPIQIQGKHIEIKYDKKYIVLTKYDFLANNEDRNERLELPENKSIL